MQVNQLHFIFGWNEIVKNDVISLAGHGSTCAIVYPLSFQSRNHTQRGTSSTSTLRGCSVPVQKSEVDSPPRA
jgi:hypothetical protein